MYSDFELKTYKLIDKFLKKLISNNECLPSEIDKDFNSQETQYAYKIMVSENLVHSKKGFPDFNSPVTIGSNGLEVLKVGGYLAHLNIIKEQVNSDHHAKKLELEKTKVDFELAKKYLKEYPITKWTARLGFIIALGLAILKLIKLLKGQV